MSVKVSENDSKSRDRLKRPISPFLEVGFEKYFDSHNVELHSKG